MTAKSAARRFNAAYWYSFMLVYDIFTARRCAKRVTCYDGSDFTMHRAAGLADYRAAIGVKVRVMDMDGK